MKQFLDSKCILTITKSIEFFPENYELVQNTMRILTKISLEENLALQIYQNSKCMLNLIQFLKTYSSDLFIILRVTFILENLANYVKDLTFILYFEFDIFADLCECFVYFSSNITVG